MRLTTYDSAVTLNSGAPRLFGRRRAADLRPPFQHRDAGAALARAARPRRARCARRRRRRRRSSSPLTVRPARAAGARCRARAAGRAGPWRASSARRSARIASRSGSDGERGDRRRVERVALEVQRLDAARAEPGAVRGIGGDEVALGDDVRADERATRAPSRGSTSSAPRARGRRGRRERDVGDVVHEPGDGELGIVGVLHRAAIRNATPAREHATATQSESARSPPSRTAPTTPSPRASCRRPPGPHAPRDRRQVVRRP